MTDLFALLILVAIYAVVGFIGAYMCDWCQ